MSKTLIIGASSNPARYSYKAAQKLLNKGYEIEMIGPRPDTIFDHTIDTQLKLFEDIDTITMYIGAKHQAEYYDYILSLRPRRIIFNPGTENPEFMEILRKNNISVEQSCTLVLLASNQY